MNHWYRVVLILLIATSAAQAQYLESRVAAAPPKREFRAAWIATVVNLDWPSTRTTNPASQRDSLISILDRLKSIGINAVMFQVRSECDAMYGSNI